MGVITSKIPENLEPARAVFLGIFSFVYVILILPMTPIPRFLNQENQVFARRTPILDTALVVVGKR